MKFWKSNIPLYPTQDVSRLKSGMNSNSIDQAKDYGVPPLQCWFPTGITLKTECQQAHLDKWHSRGYSLQCCVVTAWGRRPLPGYGSQRWKLNPHQPWRAPPAAWRTPGKHTPTARDWCACDKATSVAFRFSPAPGFAHAAARGPSPGRK